MRRAVSIPLVVGLAVSLAACPGDDQPQRPPPATTPAGEPAAPGAAGAPAIDMELPPGVTAEMVSQGQQLYGTICVACHGAEGVGTPLGPAMNDQDWIHITGEFDEIVNITRVGVQQPAQYPGMMPPMGGGNFTDDQVRAISAYVYVLSRGG